MGLWPNKFWLGSAARLRRSERLKINKWSGREDLNLRPLVSNQIPCPIEIYGFFLIVTGSYCVGVIGLSLTQKYFCFPRQKAPRPPELCRGPMTSEVSAQHELDLPGRSGADGTGIDCG